MNGKQIKKRSPPGAATPEGLYRKPQQVKIGVVCPFMVAYPGKEINGKKEN